MAAAGERSGAERVNKIGQRAGGAHDVDCPVGAEAYVVAVDQHGTCAAGRLNRRASGSVATSTSRSPLAAWCSNHSRT